MPWKLLLTTYKKIIPIFQCVLSTTIHKFRYLRPFFWTLKLQNVFKKPSVFLDSPGAFLDIRVQEAVPMLAALFRSPKDFVFTWISLIKSLCNQFPVNFREASNEVRKKFGLNFWPFMSDKFDFFERKPLKFAFLPIGAWNQLWNKLPIFFWLNKFVDTSSEKWVRLSF